MSDQGSRAHDAPHDSGFVDVIAAQDLPTGALVHVTVGGADVALANVDGYFCAFNDLCLRCGGPLTSGSLWETRLICRGCGWQYNVGCGSVVGLPGLRLESLPLRVEAGRIEIDRAPLPSPHR